VSPTFSLSEVSDISRAPSTLSNVIRMVIAAPLHRELAVLA
jgi:hypothetical protein